MLIGLLVCPAAFAETSLNVAPEFGLAATESFIVCDPDAQKTVKCLADSDTPMGISGVPVKDGGPLSISGNASIGVRFTDGKVAPFSEMEILFSFGTETDNGMSITSTMPISSETEFSTSQ